MLVIALSFVSSAHAQDAIGYMVADGADVTFSIDGEDGAVIGTVYEAGRNEKIVEVEDNATSLDSIRDDDPFAYRAAIGFDAGTAVATVYNERGWEMVATVMEDIDGGPRIVTDVEVLYDDHGRASGMVVPLDQMLMGVVMYNTDDETLEMHLDRFNFADAEELLAQEALYQRRNASYRALPPWDPACEVDEGRPLALVYPAADSRVYVPKDLDGERSRVVFQASHREADAELFWHLDDAFVGVTSQLHELALTPEPGEHVLTLVDQDGAEVRRSFEVLASQ